MGERLCTVAPAGIRSWATFLEALGGVRPFAHMLETVHRRPGREIEFRTDLFEFLAQNPDAATIFDAAMSERTAACAPASPMPTTSRTFVVVDLGGGAGTLLVGASCAAIRT